MTDYKLWTLGWLDGLVKKSSFSFHRWDYLSRESVNAAFFVANVVIFLLNHPINQVFIMHNQSYLLSNSYFSKIIILFKKGADFLPKFYLKKHVITTFATKKARKCDIWEEEKTRNCSINRLTTQIITSVKGKAWFFD